MAGECISPIDCNSPEISPEQAFKKLIKKDANGCPALNVVVVDAAEAEICDPYITCDNTNDLGWRTIFFQMITVDTNGCWALRVIQSA